MPAHTSASSRRRRLGACCVVLLLACVVAASTGDYDHETQKRISAAISSATYGIIIDVGSSGSRLRIYRISDDKVNAVFPQPEDEHLFEIEPSISSHTDGPASLQSLIDSAKLYIPAPDHNRTVLWVKATAGLRIFDEKVLDVLFDRLDQWLRRHCPFQFISSEVLGGEEEALFAYISINYLKGTLFQPPMDRVGILDMGGASMQIAHKPLKFVLAESYSFYVHGERRTVYATSQIRFGLDTAVQRAFNMLARAPEAAQATSIPFPCFNTGVEVVKEAAGRNVTFIGTGDNVGCLNVTNRLLHRDYVCLMPPCPFMGIHIDPFTEGRRFYGISNYFYIANGLGLLGWNEEKAITPRQIRKASEELCSTPGDEARSKGPPWKYRINHCFGGHYVANILEAYGFGLDDDNVVFLRHFMGQMADWSLGAILYETQAMPLFLPRMDRSVCKHAPKVGEVGVEVPKLEQQEVAKFEVGADDDAPGGERSIESAFSLPSDPRIAGFFGGGSAFAGAFAGAFASLSVVQLIFIFGARARQRRRTSKASDLALIACAQPLEDGVALRPDLGGRTGRGVGEENEPLCCLVQETAAASSHSGHRGGMQPQGGGARGFVLAAS